MRIPQGAIRSEWERIRAHDILYLLSLKPTLRRGENVPAELAAAPFWYERERERESQTPLSSQYEHRS